MERKDATNKVPQGELFRPLEKYFFYLIISAQNAEISQGNFLIAEY